MCVCERESGWKGEWMGDRMNERGVEGRVSESRLKSGHLQVLPPPIMPLHPPQVISLRSYLLHYAIARCSAPDSPPPQPHPSHSHHHHHHHHHSHSVGVDVAAFAALRSTLTSALAVLVKRSWLDASGRPDLAQDSAFFQVG